MNNKTKRMIQNHQQRAELGNVDEKNRTVEVTWSTGAKGIRTGWDGPYYEELSMKPEHVDMSRLESGAAPVLSTHDRSSLDGVIGVVDKAWLENGVGKALLRFSASDDNADKTFKKIQERVLRNVSVGYSVSQYTDTTQKGDEVPTYTATRWQPQEISIVPVGFDQKATVRNEDLKTNEVEIIERSSITQTEATQMADKKESTDNQSVAASTVDVKALQAEATSQERARIADITQAVRAAKLDESLVKEFIEKGTSVTDAAREIFKKLEERSNSTMKSAALPSVEVTRDEQETKKEALTNVLSNRMNNKVALDEKGRLFFGMSAVRMIEGYIGRKPGETESQIATRAMTTSDLPNILANVAEKSMRQEYMVQPQSFKPWTKQGTLRNYKSANRLLLGDYPNLEEVDEHGEAKMGAVGESKQAIQLKRYMKAINFTKEMIINDDLNALSDFSTKGARAAARLESALVYTSTLVANNNMDDGVALFHANHGNLAASGTDITVAAVAAGVAAMRNQKTVDGLDFLDLAPKFLICGAAKEITARQLVSTSLLATQLSNINPYAGQLIVVVDPRITDNSWFLSADPSQIDTIELAKLEGEDGPIVTVEKGKVPGSILITTEHSVGAQALDYRGLYKNAGT